MTVQVYWNSTRKLYSIRRDRKVVGHADRLVLEDVSFHVSRSGQARVRRTGVKTVHAWVNGTLVDAELDLGRPAHLVRYNPYIDPGFHADYRLLDGCRHLLMGRSASGRPVLFAYDPQYHSETEPMTCHSRPSTGLPIGRPAPSP